MNPFKNLIIISFLLIIGCSKKQPVNITYEGLAPTDVVIIIEITNFIKETDNRVFEIYMIIITNEIECSQETKDIISYNLNFISKQLNSFEEQFEDFLKDSHSSNFLNNVEQNIKDINQTLEQLRTNARKCHTNGMIRQNKYSSIHAGKLIRNASINPMI